MKNFKAKKIKNLFLKDPDMYDGIKSIHIPADRIWKPDILLGNEKNYSIECLVYNYITVNYRKQRYGVKPRIFIIS